MRPLALEVQALQHTDYLDKLYQAREEELNSAQDDLQALRDRHMELTESWIASRSYLQEIESGNLGDPQAHIHHKHPPEPPVGKQARITELWAAVSGGVLLLAFAALLTFVGMVGLDHPGWGSLCHD